MTGGCCGMELRPRWTRRSSRTVLPAASVDHETKGGAGGREDRRRIWEPTRQPESRRDAAQRSNWRTPWLAWFASESADTPSDCRVDSACEFAASAFMSALTRLAAPVSRMLPTCFVKS